MRLTIDVRNDSGLGAPAPLLIRRWVKAVLPATRKSVELSVRIVDAKESAVLNKRYRGKSGATNVLSFPCETLPGVALPQIGDLVICAPVVTREAREQGKPCEAHWAHMVVHGVLHLLGYDHVLDTEAARMEAMERTILGRLGYPDPYRTEAA